MKKVNLGCGNTTPKEWINVDYAPGAFLAKIPIVNALKLTKMKWDNNIKIHNLLKPFPWPTNSIDEVYTSHTLEHFTRQEGKRFLLECYRVLKRGGVIRVVVPDLKAEINSYLSGKTHSDFFVEHLMVLYPNPRNLLQKLLMPLIAFPHKCMYDSEALLAILNKIGFRASAKNPFESKIDDIRDIELEERTVNAVIVEAIK